MFSLTSLIPEIIELLLSLLTQVSFWVVVALVAFMYNRVSKARFRMFGIKGEPVWRQTAQAALHGLVGGFAGSIFMVLMGISFEEIPIGQLLLLSVLLMLVSPHLLCFSYSGGLISLFSILFGYPKVNVPQLMGLVAILHMVESVLILISGHLGATPIFTKNEEGRLIGGFTLQKFWPIPVVALSFAVMQGTDAIGKPEWWPLLRPDLAVLPSLQFALMGVVAVLGYGDLALARTPVEKSRLSARNLGAFSLVLLFLAFLSSRFPSLMMLAALFSPLGHEFVIYLGQQSEIGKEPLFVPPDKGVMLLEVIPGSIAAKVGLRSADIIVAINGNAVNNRNELEEALWWHPQQFDIEYFSHNKKAFLRETVLLKYGQPFGIIPVPQGDEPYYTDLKISGLFRGLWKKLKS